MPLLVACRCLSRSMRHCFLCKWTCLLVSESYRLVWKCHLFDLYNARNRIGLKFDNILRKNQNGFHNLTNIDYPKNSRRRTGKKPTGNNIICRLYKSLWFHTQMEDRINSTRIRYTKRNRRSHKDSLQKIQSESAFPGHCSWGTARTHSSSIPLYHLYRTSIDKIKENGFELTKKRSRRYPAKTITDADNADDIAILANAPAQAETLLYSLERYSAGIALRVNAHKTEYIYLYIHFFLSLIKEFILGLKEFEKNSQKSFPLGQSTFRYSLVTVKNMKNMRCFSYYKCFIMINDTKNI